MAKLQIKKSNETGKVPQPADLDWGELAINYTDGKLFYKKHGTSTVELLNVDTNTVTRLRGTSSGTYTSGDLTLLAGTNITISQSGSDYTIASAGGADSTKLPLAGGTLTGTLNFNSADQSAILQHNGTAVAWYGRLLVKNATADVSSFLGNYNSKAGVFAHNNALTAWAPLYVNTLGNNGEGTVYLPHNATYTLSGDNTAYAILNAGNYNSYAPTLAGTGASGTWGISVTGSAASATSATTVSRGSGIIANVTAPGSGTYNQHVLYATNTEFGVEAALATDSLEGNKLPLVFTWRGGYDTLGGLKITGSSSAQLGGNAVLHAGNYNSYALPLAGGTLTGALSITDATQSTSTSTGALKVTGGVGVAKNLYVGGRIYTTQAIEMSSTDNGLYHASNNMSFDSPGNDTFRIVNGRGAGAFSATLLFKSGYAGNTYGAVIGGVDGQIRLQTNRGDAFVSSTTATSIFDEVGGTRIVVSTGSQVQVYNNLTLMNNGSLTAGAITASDVTLTGELRGPATMYIDPAAVGDNTGTLVIRGNLQVDGTTTTINSTTVAIDDLNLQLAADAPNAAAANGAGVSVGGAGATFTYTSANDSWNVNKKLNVDTNLTISGTTDGIITLNKSSGSYWNYINFNYQGTRRFYFGLNASLEPELATDNGSVFRVPGSMTVGSMTIGGNTVWTAGNDGSGSGLDADLLDGLDSSSYWTKSGSWWGAGFAGSRLQGVSANGGEFVLIQDHPTTGQISVLVDGAYIAGENNGFWMTPGNNWNTRYGFYWNGSQIDFRQGTAPVVFGGFVGIGGSFGSDDGNWGARLNVGGAPHARIDARCSNDGIVTTMYSHQGQNSGKMGTMSDHRLALIANGSEYISVLTNGNVGIGVNVPSSGDKVEIVGALRIHTGNNWDAIKIYTDGANGYIQGLGDETGLRIRSEYGNILLADNRGSVGIGTDSPQRRLHVAGSGSDGTEVSRITSSSNINNGQYHWITSALAPNETNAHIISIVGKALSTKNSGYFGFRYQGDGSNSNYISIGGYAADNILNITMNSRVGINTVNPTYALHVAGDIYANGGWLRVSGNQGLYFESWAGGWYMQDSTWIRTYSEKSVYTGSGVLGTNSGGVSSGYGGASPPSGGAIISGNTGIGTSSPTKRLEVKGTANGSVIRASVTDGAGSASFGYGFYIDNTAHEIAQIVANYVSSGNSGYGGLKFNVSNNGLYTLMTLEYTGKVGIGIETPSEKLEVNGNILAFGSASNTAGAGVNIWLGPANNSRDIGIRRAGNAVMAFDRYNGGWYENARFHASGNFSIGNATDNGYKLEVNGSFAATTKSFVIDHPTKPGKKLRYGSLEGPENGVYVRGRLRGTKIQLPDYWTGLVDPDSITVQLTPHGRRQDIWVTKIADNCVYVQGTTQPDCYYFIQAERIDVEKLQVELDA